MKVLLINHFPLEGSGSGTYTKNIALHLRKRGHEVCVIFPENRPVLMLPGIRMFPVMFSTGKASWSSLPFTVAHLYTWMCWVRLSKRRTIYYARCIRRSLYFTL